MPSQWDFTQTAVTFRAFVAVSPSLSFNKSNSCRYLATNLKFKPYFQITFWNNVYTVANIVPSLVTLILLGSYSDRGGRKRAILPGLMGSILRVSSSEHKWRKEQHFAFL